MHAVVRILAVLVGAAAGVVLVFAVTVPVVLLTVGELGDTAARRFAWLCVAAGSALGGREGGRRSSDHLGRDVLRTTTILLWGATLVFLPAFGLGLFIAPFAIVSTIALVVSRRWRRAAPPWTPAQRVLAVAITVIAACGLLALGLPRAG